MNNEFLQTEEAIVAMLKTVYDPEIPVNVYDLGLIYKVDIDEEKNVRIDMTLTAPNCPAADFILEDVRMKVELPIKYMQDTWEQCRGKPRLRAGMGQGHDDGGG